MQTKIIMLYWCFLFCPIIPFAQTQLKYTSGQIVSVSGKKQTDTIPWCMITYSNDSLLKGSNSQNMQHNQTSSDFEGLFALKIPNKNCGKSFLIAEMMGYEPFFVNMDTVTTNNILVNLQPKTYDILVTYNKDTVYWKCTNLTDYKYAVIRPNYENDIDGEVFIEEKSSVWIDTLGERKLLPEPQMGFSKWLKDFISKGNVGGSTIIEVIINRKPIEVNYFSGKIERAGFDFIKDEEWIIPHSFLSSAWMRKSKYNSPKIIKITFKETN